MPSIVLTGAPQSGIQEAIPVWEKIDWSPEVEQGIYKDWGKYYSRRRRESISMNYYDKALKLSPNDHATLYHRSQSRRKTARIESALKDSREAQRLLKNVSVQNAPVNLEVCDALYELNQFENAKAELYNNTRIFTGNKTKAFENRLHVVDENIKDACGDGLSPFILDNENVMSLVKELLNEKARVDNRPLWKKLKEQGKCDILSIPEIKEQILSPLEIARRKRAFDICNQVYIDRTWIDILFLKNLRDNPNLLLDQCKNSKGVLRSLTENQYEVIKKFLKMIHARSPIYYVRYKKYANMDRLRKFQEALLFRIQYQTRRNMITALETIRRLRTEKNLTRLASYIEEIMGNYVVLKTNRIMPWKIEFINEVYNTLGLALAEQYYVPKNFKQTTGNPLHHLLHLNMNKTMEISKFVFGDRSTHQDQDIVDPAITKSRQMIARLEKRMIFAKHSIEKCYLLHQIASIHLQFNRYDECGFVARKAIQETKNCNSYLWSFLSTIIIVKSSAALNKTERTKEVLRKALKIAQKLHSPEIIDFVETCMAQNERLYLKLSASRRESKMSARSSL
ncbi:uncharacterized protein LOC115770100 isoform X1 [Drosophila novamexicana]|uniref:uncharacterized protein LOC115770100 isoform X1 n=2 Tax=Drosophila novamexicana TaxID=47314 RepID=UPI0011E592C8|nr:uncharacterized protein LOC115770100 isoform X1 [Drosophila novamexicana]